MDLQYLKGYDNRMKRKTGLYENGSAMLLLRLGSMMLIAMLLLLNCDNPLDSSIDVKYKVTGTAETVDITYENRDGGTSQEADVEVPWSYSFTGHPGDFVYISAQNQGSTGTVTVTILTDGDVVKTSTSEGAYVIATAHGSL